jgi:hypothetical protein
MLSSDELLDVMFTELIRRLSGTDPEYDAEIVRSFSESLNIPKRKILAKIRTHCGGGQNTVN